MCLLSWVGHPLVLVLHSARQLNFGRQHEAQAVRVQSHYPGGLPKLKFLFVDKLGYHFVGNELKVKTEDQPILIIYLTVL